MQWIMDHLPLIGGAVYLLLNELIAFNPNLKSNSLIQMLLSVVGVYKPQP